MNFLGQTQTGLIWLFDEANLGFYWIYEPWHDGFINCKVNVSVKFLYCSLAIEN